MPFLTPGGACASAMFGGSSVRTAEMPQEPAEAVPTGCASGNSTGTPADAARCVVVRLDLAGNGLSGALEMEHLCALPWLGELFLQGNGAGLAGATLLPEGGDVASGDVASANWPDGCFQSLRVLNLEGNGLTGALPAWLPRLDALEGVSLGGNDFSIPTDWDDAIAAAESAPGENGALPRPGPSVRTGESAERLIRRCRSFSTTCSGMPPLSCAAFGAHYKIELDDPSKCIYCAPYAITRSLISLIALSVAFCGLLALYVVLLNRDRTAMKRWVSTLSIFFAHLQVLAVLGNLSLQWPPPVKTAMGLLSFSVVGTQLLQPECLFQIINPAFVLTLSQLSIMLLMLLVGSTLARCRGWLQPARRDKAWFILTILVQFLFGTTWRLSFRLFQQSSGTSWTELVLGSSVSAAAMLTICFSAASFAWQIHDHHRLRDYVESSKMASARLVDGAPAVDTSRGYLPPLPHAWRNLVGKLRLPPALKQWIGGVRGPLVTAWRHDEGREGGMQMEQQARLSVPRSGKAEAAQSPEHHRTDPRLDGEHTEGSLSAPTAGHGSLERPIALAFATVSSRSNAPSSARWEARSARLEAKETRMRYLTDRYAAHAPYWQFVVWARQLALILDATVARAVDTLLGVYIHSGIAISILGVAWWYHHTVRPFAFAFQNTVEGVLFVFDIGLVVLGTAYTALRRSDAGPITVAAMEMATVLVMTVSLLYTGIHLAWGYHRGKLQQTQVERDEELRLAREAHARFLAEANVFQPRLRGLSAMARFSGNSSSSSAASVAAPTAQGAQAPVEGPAGAKGLQVQRQPGNSDADGVCFTTI